MTKRDLVRFLERKQSEKKTAILNDHKALCDELLQKTYAEIGLTTLAEKMQMILAEASDLWKSWMEKYENADWIELNNGYYSIIGVLSACTCDEGATFNRLSRNELRIKPVEIENADEAHITQQKYVNDTFNTVIATVQQMQSSKQAAVYLKELGFDLSELEKPVPEAQTALMVPIDTRYLFVKAA